MDIFDVLEHLECRPLMYLRTKDIYLLDSYIGGFLTCKFMLKKTEKELNFQTEFHEWIRLKYNFERGYTWADYIFKISQHENLNSVDVFFREYHLFKNDQ